MEFTLEQKLRVLEEVLYDLIQDVKNEHCPDHYFLCFRIRYFIRSIVGKRISISEIEIYIPEFINNRPAHIENIYEEGWWHECDFESRINYLNKLIDGIKTKISESRARAQRTDRENGSDESNTSQAIQ